MYRAVLILIILIAAALPAIAQSRRAKTYSESPTKTEKHSPTKFEDEDNKPAKTKDDDVVRIETDLITVPVKITARSGKLVRDLKETEFKIFENGTEQEIAYFSNDEQPFTVALLLDMSYSSVFKLREIQAAADLFVGQLKPDDKVMVVAFDEKVRVLCEATTNRRAIGLAIKGSRIGSGTSVYTALDVTLNDKFRGIVGRKAVVMLTDGVDTSSKVASARSLLRDFGETDALVFPIQYDTYDDVRKNRRKDAEILYDENDRPYVSNRPPGKGEREEDYRDADDFLHSIADQTGGHVYRVRSTSSLRDAFAAIADELRKTYSLGYYPTSERKAGETYSIKVRVYRPNLIIRAREIYLGSGKAQPK
jgi:Ca-activated chloride channel family protein